MMFGHACARRTQLDGFSVILRAGAFEPSEAFADRTLSLPICDDRRVGGAQVVEAPRTLVPISARGA
jgi:hypothetical protein